MHLHTVDPTLDLTHHTIGEFLANMGGRPIRYEDAGGHIVNTDSCRGLIAWYVLIEALPDAVLVGPVRFGLGRGARGFTTRQWLREPAAVAYPFDADRSSVWAFRGDLGFEVGRSLGDIERAQEASR